MRQEQEKATEEVTEVAPGVLRKFFEFRDLSTDRSFAEPTR